MATLRDLPIATTIPTQRGGFGPNPHVDARHDDVLEPLGSQS